MFIGMLDAGYSSYTSLKVFDSVRNNNQVLDSWDFVSREAAVADNDAHGTACFSTIAANIPGQFVGTAPKASFLLYRTEEAATEYPIEEHNWVCGAERVDSAGGDVISSSLGYTTFDNAAFNHTYADMNGNSTTAAIGADLAAKKGILVVNAAGNDGDKPWNYLSTPADGDSVLAVGAVTTAGVVAGFSSYGPSSDGQTKPDVASVGAGTIVAFTNNTFGGNNGTSFACPNMAGLATCLWQGFPEFNNIKILNALRQAGSIFNTPNDRIGYGIPDVKKAVLNLLKDFATSNASVSSCRTVINWTSKDVSAMNYVLERKAPGDVNYKIVGTQSGSGAVFTTRSYQFTDTLINVQSGQISYRIKQVIDTAAASFMADYIDTVSVNLTSSCIATAIDPITNNNDIILSPNPAGNEAFLRITTNNPIQKITLKIVNAAGQVVFINHYSKNFGAATFSISLAALASGKYEALIYDGEKLMATKTLVKLSGRK